MTVLVGYRRYCGNLLQAFGHDRNRRGQVFFRWLYELPVLILIAVVVLVVVRPY